MKSHSMDGWTYDPAKDGTRLDTQLDTIRELMLDGVYRTLEEIAKATGAGASSVSAQLRNLRKERYGSHTVDRVRDGNVYRYAVAKRG